MGVIFIKTIHKKHGFTLVELIVVLSILAILATLLIPSLTGYIEKAKKQAVLTEAKEVWTATQAALSECYAMYPESFEESCKFTSTIGGEKMTKLGRISNGALNALQRNPKDQTEVNTSSRRVARQVLIYLESADKNAKPRYTFGNGAIPTGNSRPSNYFKDKRYPYSDFPYEKRESRCTQFWEKWIHGNHDRRKRTNHC